MRLKEKEVEVGYLYLTTVNQYRAVLAMKVQYPCPKDMELH